MGIEYYMNLVFSFIQLIAISIGDWSSVNAVLCPKFENKIYSKGLPSDLSILICSIHNFTGI